MNPITKDIIDAIKTRHLSKDAENFLIHWLSDEEKTNEDREIVKELAMSNTYPARQSNLFRGCTELMDEQVESYTISCVIASRFAQEDGYVVAIDTDRYCFKTFDLSNFIWDLIHEIIYEGKEHSYSEKFLDICEEVSGEDEVFVMTDLSQSVVFKVSSIGEEL